MTPDQLAQFLDQLGQKLTPVASQVFSIYVTQQYVVAFTWIGVTFFFFLASVLFAIGAALVIQRINRRAQADYLALAETKYRVDLENYEKRKKDYEAGYAQAKYSYSYPPAPPTLSPVPFTDEQNFVFWLSVFVAVCAAVFFLAAILANLPNLLNPQYGALHNILQDIPKP